MSRSLSDLSINFREQAIELLRNCENKGVYMVPFFTLRSPLEQAKLWRQSRSKEKINRRLEELHGKGLHNIAMWIEQAGRQDGRWATNAMPGYSWHNYGLAMDCFLKEDGKAIWNGDHTGYKIYAEEAKKLGLLCGLDWERYPDPVHVQSMRERVREYYTDADINEACVPKSIEE